MTKEKVAVIGTDDIVNPSLDLPIATPLAFDRYVLVMLDIPNKRGGVVGWASKDEILNAEVKRCDGEDCYHVPHSKLHHFDKEEFKKLSWTPTFNLWNLASD
jgi:hypothetical protein